MKATIRFLGINHDGKDLSTSSVKTVTLDYSGIVGDSHAGLTRSSCVRVRNQYPKGTEIRNTRQVSALSSEELLSIQSAMELTDLDPSWVGANLIVDGLPEFSKLPPSSRLIANNGASLVVDMENAPCKFPGEIIEQHRPGYGNRFARAALGKRGVTLWVEHPGVLSVGDELTLHIPPTCQWQPS